MAALAVPQTALDLQILLQERLEMQPKEFEKQFDVEETDDKLVLKVHRDSNGKCVWLERHLWTVANSYVRELGGSYFKPERKWEIPLKDGTDSEATNKEAPSEIQTPPLKPVPKEIIQDYDKMRSRIENKLEEGSIPLESNNDGELELANINSIIESPFQFRSTYNERKIDELRDSIKEVGLLQPLVVRENGAGALEIIAGHRRFKALQKAGLEKALVIKRNMSDEEAIFTQLAENIQREDASDYDIGKALHQLNLKGFSQEKIGEKISLKQKQVSNYISHYRFCENISTVVLNVDSSGLKEGQTREVRRHDTNTIKKQVKKLELKPNTKITKQAIKTLHKNILREDLEIFQKELKKFLEENPYLTTVLSYPKRGSFGDSDFRGNTSGFLLVELLRHFKPNTVYDPMEGSGTTRDVCNAMGIKYLAHENFQRNDILEGFDLLQNEPPENDLTFFHPPYWDIIKYSDNPNDLSCSSSWTCFCEQLETCVAKLLRKTKILAILIADIYKGSDQQYHSPLPTLLLNHQDRLIRILVKLQEHFSRGAERTKPVIPILHEYVLLLRGDYSG